MKFFVDRKNRRFVKSAASNVALDRLVLKRRDLVPLEVIFVENGAAVATPAGTSITAALKRNFSDANFLVLAESGTLNLNTIPLEAAFATSPASIPAYLEVRWTATGEATRTATLQAEIQNSVIIGTEGTPAAIPDLKANQAQAEAGTDNDKWMTPLRTRQAIAELAPPPTWDSVLNKPATFPPSAHTHLKSEITGLDADLAALSASDAALDDRIDHLTANLDPAALDSIAEAAASINSLQTQINGKAPIAHTHTASQITDFASAVVAVSPPVDWSSLTGKPTEFPPSAHTHPASSITGLSDYIVASAPGLSIVTTTHIADGLTDTYSVSGLASADPSHVLVSLNGVTQNPGTDYTVNFATGKIIFDDYPAANQQIVFTALGLRSVQRPIDPTLYIYAFDQSANGLTTYSGRLLNANRPAAPALPETASTWTIRRSTLNAAGRVLSTASAIGSWLNRETLAYA